MSAVWKPGTTAEDRRQHHADLHAWADGIRASLPLAHRELLERARTISGPGSADARARALEVWMAACAAGPPRPVSKHWDPEPVIDFESDPRLTEADRAQMRSLAERGQRRLQDRFGTAKRG